MRSACNVRARANYVATFRLFSHHLRVPIRVHKDHRVCDRQIQTNSARSAKIKSEDQSVREMRTRSQGRAGRASDAASACVCVCVWLNLVLSRNTNVSSEDLNLSMAM